MKPFSFQVSSLCLIIAISAAIPACTNRASSSYTLSNDAFRLSVSVHEPEIHVILEERQMPMKLSEGNYLYRAQVSGSKDTIFTLQYPAVTISG